MTVSADISHLFQHLDLSFCGAVNYAERMRQPDPIGVASKRAFEVKNAIPLIGVETWHSLREARNEHFLNHRSLQDDRRSIALAKDVFDMFVR